MLKPMVDVLSDVKSDGDKSNVKSTGDKSDVKSDGD